MACFVAGTAEDEMMEGYFYWCGVLLNGFAVGLVSLFVWVWFIWPFVQAVSLTKVTVKALGKGRKTSILKLFWWAYNRLCFGKDFTTIRFDLFEWSDVGEWIIYSEREY